MSDSSRAAARPLTPAAEAEPCNCFSQMDELLKPHGGALMCNLFGPPRACVSTYRLRPPEKGKRRKKVPIVFASFCPFCGVHYPKES